MYLLSNTPNSILSDTSTVGSFDDSNTHRKNAKKELNTHCQTPIATIRKKTIVAAAISTISQSLIVDFSVKRK